MKTTRIQFIQGSVSVCVAGMLSGHLGQPDDRIGVDVDQASGLSDAAALGEVLEHGAGLRLGEMGLEQRRALAFGKALLAGATGQAASVLGGGVAKGDAEVAVVALAKVGAVGVEAAEAAEIVHRSHHPGLLSRLLPQT